MQNKKNHSRMQQRNPTEKNRGKNSKRSTEMTSYCDVTNPTHHLQPKIDKNKVGEYAFRIYGEIVSSGRTSSGETDIPILKEKGARSALL